MMYVSQMGLRGTGSGILTKRCTFSQLGRSCRVWGGSVGVRRAILARAYTLLTLLPIFRLLEAIPGSAWQRNAGKDLAVELKGA